MRAPCRQPHSIAVGATAPCTIMEHDPGPILLGVDGDPPSTVGGEVVEAPNLCVQKSDQKMELQPGILRHVIRKSSVPSCVITNHDRCTTRERWGCDCDPRITLI